MEDTRADIMIVDDNALNLRVLSGTLKKAGYEVRPANGGELALAAIDAKPPELILLDIMMPGLNGYEVCERLKANKKTRDIPVIFITALDDIKDKVKAFSMGCVDYISKPFQEEEILARVKTHIRMGRLQKDLIIQNNLLQAETEKKEALILDLQALVKNVKVLSGLLPICAKCKKIRSDEGYWEQIENFIETHTEAFFSHGICPDCMEALYGDQEWYQKKRPTIVHKSTTRQKDITLQKDYENPVPLTEEPQKDTTLQRDISLSLKKFNGGKTGPLAAEFCFDKSLALFQGHFPGSPLLPGVMQIEMVRFVLEKARKKQFTIHHIKKNKFLKPILPGDPIQVEMDCSEKDNATAVTAKLLVNKDTAGILKMTFSPVENKEVYP